MEITFWIAFIAGLVSFLSPCCLPLVPAYVSYMGGRLTHTVGAAVSLGDGAAALRPSFAVRLNTFLHGLAFVGGFSFIFVSIGLLGTAFVQQIGRQNIALVTDIISRTGGILIIFFGLHFMGLLPRLLRWLLTQPHIIGSPLTPLAVSTVAGVLISWAFVDLLIALPIVAVLLLWLFVGGAFIRPQAFWTSAISAILTGLYSDTRIQMTARGGQGLASSAIMGVIFAAGWTPCLGPIYGSILTLALTGQNVAQAGTLLLAYSLGLGVPFLIAALLLDSTQGIVRKLQRHVHKIEVFAGVMLVVVGILVASGRLQSLSQYFATEFADLSYRMEECASQISMGEIGLGDFVNCVSGEASQPAAIDTVPST
ncbi:MAG: cytochrome c biogenesis protein CcdA [Anaerolinea sp.]|nr:cytochrome c biogenesis protein CcdA [Anaerolinea sp.]